MRPRRTKLNEGIKQTNKSPDSSRTGRERDAGKPLQVLGEPKGLTERKAREM